jgi:hypothetical protein
MQKISRLSLAVITAALATVPVQRATAKTIPSVRLPGSRSSMVRQHEIAVEEHYSFLRTPNDVRRLVEAGGLVPITDGDNYALSKVMFAYARPVVKSFLERFAAEYRDSTGSRLVVTSLVRPEVLQPRNASVLSVHPAGMAVDLRVPKDARARAFLERSLLGMERQQLLDVTRERRPAHYHVAVFPEAYQAYAAQQHMTLSLVAQGATRGTGAAAASLAPSTAPSAATTQPATQRSTTTMPAPAPVVMEHTDVVIAMPNRTLGLVLGLIALALGAVLLTHDMRMTGARGR